MVSLKPDFFTWGRCSRTGRNGTARVGLIRSGEGLGGGGWRWEPSSSVPSIPSRASSLAKLFFPSELCCSQLRFLETVMGLRGGRHPDVSVAPSRPLAQEGGWIFSMKAERKKAKHHVKTKILFFLKLASGSIQLPSSQSA